MHSNLLNIEFSYSFTGPTRSELLCNKCLLWDVIGPEPKCPQMFFPESPRVPAKQLS